jgi:hypothetical protein
MRLRARAVLPAVILLVAAAAMHAQSSRRLTTIAAIHQFPGVYHLQNVVLRGELVERAGKYVLRADDREMRVLLKGATAKDGPVEIRGQMIDVGRLEPNDPRVAGYIDAATGSPDTVAERWPKPGEDLIVVVNAVTEAQLETMPTIRALSLEPWKFEGQTVSVIGNFRGRNLFGDVGGAPGKSRYDFVLRGTEGAVWITGMRPRGKGFDLDVDRRADTNAWLDVTGTVSRDRGLVLIEATQISLGKQPEEQAPAEEPAAPAVPLLPAEVIFTSPTSNETEVPTTTTVRMQFSRGLLESSIDGHFRATYSGASTPLEFKTTYDAALRAVEIRFAMPLQRFGTVRVETLEGLKAFDGAPVAPYTLTFSIGGA